VVAAEDTVAAVAADVVAAAEGAEDKRKEL
jgi:hypothetical protein